MKAPFINRVVLRNYKSIESCVVDLEPLTFLVGANGSGKSNFLDSLRFLRDALRTSLDNALRERGGIREVRRRSAGHPTHFGLRAEFDLPGGQRGWYAFLIGAARGEAYEVQREVCKLVSAPHGPSFFEVNSGVVQSSVEKPPAAARDRFYLVNASGIDAFRPVYEAFSNMGFYHLNPDVIRDVQSPDEGKLLARDGSNLTSVFQRIANSRDERQELIENYLAKIVPGVHGVYVKAVSTREILEFRQKVGRSKYPWYFPSTSMSDGTLRALAILVSLFQNDGEVIVPLVGIEEPEMALHPAAASVLLDALRDASEQTQIIITSHSADLLDNEEIKERQIRAVAVEDNNTQIAPINAEGREALLQNLFTPGELLRLNQIFPSASLFGERVAAQTDLFSG